MREIKFQARDAITGKWDTFTLAMLHHGVAREFMYVDWREYTGRKDKNGKEIYEGDILSAKNGWQVVVDMTEFATMQYISGVCDKIKVIGNIYENSELLEANR